MAFDKFENIVAWQKSHELAVTIYKELSGLNDYYFRNQMQRAAVSISSNIAEGFDRNSNADFIRFLIIAKGSANEVKSLLYLGVQLSYIKQTRMVYLVDEISEIRKILTGLIKSLRRK